jgi:hypothetical protein
MCEFRGLVVQLSVFVYCHLSGMEKKSQPLAKDKEYSRTTLKNESNVRTLRHKT